MKLYEVLAGVMAVCLFCLGMTYGFDREMARRDYEKAIHNGDYEKPIVGCLWESNCVYYTKKLGE